MGYRNVNALKLKMIPCSIIMLTMVYYELLAISLVYPILWKMYGFNGTKIQALNVPYLFLILGVQ